MTTMEIRYGRAQVTFAMALAINPPGASTVSCGEELSVHTAHCQKTQRLTFAEFINKPILKLLVSYKSQTLVCP